MSALKGRPYCLFELDPVTPNSSGIKSNKIQSFFGIEAREFSNYYYKYFEHKRPVGGSKSSTVLLPPTSSSMKPLIFRRKLLNISGHKTGTRLVNDSGPSRALKCGTTPKFKFESSKNVIKNQGFNNFEFDRKSSQKHPTGLFIRRGLKSTRASKLAQTPTSPISRISTYDQISNAQNTFNGVSINVLPKAKINTSCRISRSHKIKINLLRSKIGASHKNTCESRSSLLNSPPKSCRLKEFKHYDIISPIGRGAYARVYKALDLETRILYAIKIYSKEKMNTQNRRMMLTSEVSVLRSISHRNLIRLIHVQETPSEIHLVMELVEGICMEEWSRAFSGPGVPEEIARPILKQMLRALCYLHSKNICHRDLKLQNVILTNGFVPKIIDFGFAYNSSDQSSLDFYCGTQNYMSPEIIAHVPYCGAAADCWSFGVLIFRVLTGFFPFDAQTESELDTKICSGKFAIPKRVSKEARQVIDALLVVDPVHRNTMKQLRSFKFFI
jgi:tRNA A-37 threonylcarbamoyl transferase component Bud32